MPEAAFIAWAVFILVCVVWRFWYQRRLTADFGLRRMSARIGSMEWWGGSLVSVSFSVLCLVPALELAGLMRRSEAPLFQVVLGLVVMALGIVVTSAAQITMGPSWRVGVRRGERTSLVTRGIFSVVRNPIFSGVTLAVVGGAILTPRPLTLIAAAVCIVGIEIQVRGVEEPHLQTIHGEAYTVYTRRVGRFIPGLGKLG